VSTTNLGRLFHHKEFIGQFARIIPAGGGFAIPCSFKILVSTNQDLLIFQFEFPGYAT
jgi:hypothetical protein